MRRRSSVHVGGGSRLWRLRRGRLESKKREKETQEGREKESGGGGAGGEGYE